MPLDLVSINASVSLFSLRLNVWIRSKDSRSDFSTSPCLELKSKLFRLLFGLLWFFALYRIVLIDFVDEDRLF